MSAVDDLTELVECVGAAERAALASKWKQRSDVEALRRQVQRTLDEKRNLERRSTAAAPEVSNAGQVSHAEAARLEADAVAAVSVARLAVQEAHLAVLKARIARIDAGDAEPEAAAADGHVPLHGRNAVSRHGAALARGLRGEIEYILTRKPRSVVKSLAISVALGLLYLGFIRVFEWDKNQKWLPYLGLWVISVVLGGAVCVNAMSFDAMRVRAALDGGARLWHLLVSRTWLWSAWSPLSASCSAACSPGGPVTWVRSSTPAR
jgi:hypothetical protein